MEKVGLVFSGNAAEAVAASRQVDNALARTQHTANNFGKEVRGAEHDVGRFSRGMLAGSGVLHGYGRAIAFASTAFLGGAGLTIAFRAATDAMQENQRLSLQTNAIIKATGGVAGITARHIEELATSVQAHTAISSASVKEAENVLLSFQRVRDSVGEGAHVFDLATHSIADLSAFMGTDTVTAARSLGKALNDPISGMQTLRRSGISFTKAQQDMIKGWLQHGQIVRAQLYILKQVDSVVHGQAEAVGKSLPGAIQRLKNTSTDLAASLLQGLAPAFGHVVDRVQEFETRLSKNGDEQERVRRIGQQVGQVLGNIFGVLQTGVRIVGGVTEQLGGVNNALGIGIGMWIAWKVAAIASAEAAAAAQLVAAGVVEKAWKAVLIRTGWGVLALAAGAAAAYTIEHWDQVKVYFDAFWVTLRDGAQIAWNAIKVDAYEAALAVIEPFSHLPGGLGAWARRSKDRLKKELGGILDDQRQLVDEIHNVWAVGGEVSGADFAKMLKSGYEKGIASGKKAGPSVGESRTAAKAGTSLAGQTQQGAGALQQGIVETARSALGVPYKYGGAPSISSPTDCSGLMVAVFSQHGITLPRTSQSQYAQAPIKNARPLAVGDLVFSEGVHPGHVGLYIGNGAVLEDPHTGDRVKIVALDSFGWNGESARWWGGADTGATHTGATAAPPTYHVAPAKAKASDVTKLSGPLREQVALAGQAVALADPGSKAWVAATEKQVDVWQLAIDQLAGRIKGKGPGARAELEAAITGYQTNIKQAQQQLVSTAIEGTPEDQARLSALQRGTTKSALFQQMRIVGDRIDEVTKLARGLKGQPLAQAQAQITTLNQQLIDLTNQAFPSPEMAAKGTRRTLLDQVQFILNHLTTQLPRVAGQVRKATEELRARIQKAAADGLTAKEGDVLSNALSKLWNRQQAAVALGQATNQVRSEMARVAAAVSDMPADARVKLDPQLVALRRSITSIGSQADLDKVKSQMDKVTQAIADAAAKANDEVQYQQGLTSDAFNALLSKAYQVFDAQTQKLLDDAQAYVTQFGFWATANGLTPTEQALQERTAAKAAADAKRRIGDIQTQIAAMQAPVNLEREAGESLEAYRRRVADATEERNKQLADLNDQLQNELYDQETTRLEGVAGAERKAADDALASQRQDIQSRRDLLKEELQNEVNDEIARWQRGEENAATAQEHIVAILGSYGINYQSAGSLLGAAFETGFQAALDRLAKRIQDLLASQQAAAQAQQALEQAQSDADVSVAQAYAEAARQAATDAGLPGTYTVSGGEVYYQSTVGKYGYKPMFQHGGTVPGTYTGRADTILGALTPGERVLDREQNDFFTRWMRGGGGGGGALQVHFHGHVWDRDEIVRDITEAQQRVGGYTPGGIFGGRG